METQFAKNFPLQAAVGRVAFVLALVSLGLFGWYVPAERDAYSRVLGDFHSEIPALTKVLLWVPNVAIWILAGGLAIAVLVVQFRVRDRTGGVLFHMLIVLSCCVAFLVYREVMQEPVWTLMQSVR